MQKQPKIIFLAGPPGSGKGTQAQLLKERLGLKIIQVNLIIREKFKNFPNQPEVIKAKNDYQAGNLIDGHLIGQWVVEKLKTFSPELLAKGLVIDGAVRTIEEAKTIINFLRKKFGKENLKIFFIKISPQETKRRNLNRIICKDCQKPLKPKLVGKIKKCPYCGGKLVKRAMDNEEVIRNRLRVYQEKTLPTIDYLKKQGLVIDINGEQPIEKVYQDILGYL